MHSLDLMFFEFTRIFRQKEKEFIELLNKIRNKTADELDLHKINRRFKEKIEDDKGFIHLTGTNKLAECINTRKLNELPGKTIFFKGLIEGNFSVNSLPTEKILPLKKGARVMFLVNDSSGRWVNGSLGTVKSILGEKAEVILDNQNSVWVLPYTWEIFKYSFDAKLNDISKEVIGSFTQFPLRLAWAVTIHKGQGKTFDKIIIDIGRGAFAFGQTYVALSRCTSLNGIILKKKLRFSDIWLDWRVVKFLTNFQYSQAQKKLSYKEKKGIIENAIKNKEKLKIVYLKSNDEKSNRIIKPLNIGRMEFHGYEFEGVKAHCFSRNKKRTFKIERILEINPFSK